MAIVLSTEIHVSSKKTENFSISNMYKQLVAICIKYCYALQINVCHRPDPPLLVHAILETLLTHLRGHLFSRCAICMISFH